MVNLPVTEELDFEYLLELMPALHDKPSFSWLPELFSIVGVESLINLCKYAGGETITIPTLEELSTSIESLQYFYDVNIKKSKKQSDVPWSLLKKYHTICEVYTDVGDSEETD